MSKPDRLPISSDPYYSPNFYAELFRVSVSTIERKFRDHPKVLKLSEESNNGKRSRRGLRIPYSVAIEEFESQG